MRVHRGAKRPPKGQHIAEMQAFACPRSESPPGTFYAGRIPAETRAQDGGNELIRAVVSEFERNATWSAMPAGGRLSACSVISILLFHIRRGRQKEDILFPSGR